MKNSRVSIYRSVITAAAVSLSVLFATGCQDETTTPGDEIVFPESDISYMEHVQPYFNLRCANFGCHENETMAGNLSLMSYVDLTSRPGIVIAHDSESSLLMQKIDGRLPHPAYVPILINKNQLDGIRNWIDEGAKDN